MSFLILSWFLTRPCSGEYLPVNQHARAGLQTGFALYDLAKLMPFFARRYIRGLDVRTAEMGQGSGGLRGQ